MWTYYAMPLLSVCTLSFVFATPPKPLKDICLFVWSFTVLRPAQDFFYLHGDVTIAVEGLQNLGLCSALRAFEQEGIFIVCCETGPRFFIGLLKLITVRCFCYFIFPFSSKNRPIQSPLPTQWRIYSKSNFDETWYKERLLTTAINFISRFQSFISPDL
jgi:hypothetical protein